MSDLFSRSSDKTARGYENSATQLLWDIRNRIKLLNLIQENGGFDCHLMLGIFLRHSFSISNDIERFRSLCKRGMYYMEHGHEQQPELSEEDVKAELELDEDV